jgi:hypothetical protein
VRSRLSKVPDSISPDIDEDVLVTDMTTPSAMRGFIWNLAIRSVTCAFCQAAFLSIPGPEIFRPRRIQSLISDMPTGYHRRNM